MTQLESTMEPLRKELPKEVISALRSYLYATAKVQLIKPISQKIKAEALKLFKPVFAPFVFDGKAYPELDEKVGELISDYSDMDMASDEDCHRVFNYHRQKLIEKGFSAKKDCCPLLCAEQLQREAKALLIDLMQPYTGISRNSLYRTEDNQQYVELLIKLLCSLAVQQNVDLNIIKESL